MTIPKSNRVWRVDDAQANLPEVLRLAETEGLQCIGAGKTFVVARPSRSRSKTGRSRSRRWVNGWSRTHRVARTSWFLTTKQLTARLISRTM